MPNATPDHQEGRQSDVQRSGNKSIGQNTAFLRQMVFLTLLVTALVIFVGVTVAAAISEQNWLGLVVAVPTLLLLLWVLYKVIAKGWLNWRGWPTEEPRDSDHE